MIILDALSEGKVILLSTVPTGEIKNRCRLDFLRVADSDINAVRRDVVDKLSTANVNFGIVSVEVPSTRKLQTIIENPKLTYPKDFDKTSTTDLSKILLNVKGVEAITSAVVLIEDKNADQNIARFVSVIKNEFITEPLVINLKYVASSQGTGGEFKFTTSQVRKQGTFKLLGDDIDHYGKVKLNRSDEFLLETGVVEKAIKEKDVSNAVSKGENPIRAKTNKPIAIDRSKDSNNKMSTLAGVGALAAAFFLPTIVKKEKEGRSYENYVEQAVPGKKDGEDYSWTKLTDSERREIINTL